MYLMAWRKGAIIAASILTIKKPKPRIRDKRKAVQGWHKRDMQEVWG